MLVINSNNQRELTTASHFDTWYPDFNQILCYMVIPNIGGYTPSTGTIVPENASMPQALQVNGTSINYFFSPCREDMQFWTPAGTDFWTELNTSMAWGGSSWNYFLKMRLWTVWQLAAGHIVWKKIMWQYTIYESYASWISVQWNCTFRPWLLHTDWTITYLSEAQNLTFNAVTTKPAIYDVLNYETAGTTTQEGDRIIVELYIPMKHSASGGRYINMTFGAIGSATKVWTQTGAPNPVQISIE